VAGRFHSNQFQTSSKLLFTLQRKWNVVSVVPPLSVYTVRLVWEGERGEEVRENVDGQQYTSIVPSTMGATVYKLGRKYQP
jgi:hypothetical protein